MIERCKCKGNIKVTEKELYFFKEKLISISHNVKLTIEYISMRNSLIYQPNYSYLLIILCLWCIIYNKTKLDMPDFENKLDFINMIISRCYLI